MKLASLVSGNGAYCLARFDQPEALAKLFGLDTSDTSHADLISYLQHLQLEVLSPETSGLVVDPRYLFDVLDQKPKDKGVAFQVATQAKPEELPQMIANWGVDFVRNNYGVTFLTVAYHPQEHLALDKKKFVFEVYDFCQYHQINLVLELKMIGVNGGKLHKDDFPQAQLVAVQDFRKIASMLVLEDPRSPLQAATITAEIDIPWVLSIQEESYEEAKQALRDVLENGAHGFVIGKTLWQETTTMRNDDMSVDFEKVTNFLKTTGRDRLIELRRIAEELVAVETD